VILVYRVIAGDHRTAPDGATKLVGEYDSWDKAVESGLVAGNYETYVSPRDPKSSARKTRRVID
jgi:hypothetical protein